jgi:hypothetical protein
MPRWLQIALHLGIAGIGAYVSVQNGSPVASVVASGVQTALGAVAQAYNIDGTPQTTAFVAPATPAK